MFPPENAPNESFPYRVEGQVGVGSMGIVYRAVEVALERPVAIKILRPSVLDEEPPEVQSELRRRFRQEARAAAALSHPGVTTVYRVGEYEGRPYMVMEWLSGRTLEEMLDERPRLELATTLRLVVALLETLHVAHTHGVVHRDIKPGNLVVLKDGRLKVTDFGIALLQGRELVKTQAGVVLATPKFAAPEQLRGIEVDGRADLFATGILLYRMLSGRYPFEGQSFMELANAILMHEAVPIQELVPDLPAGVAAVIKKALQKERKDRYRNAPEMAEDLRPFIPVAVEEPFPISGQIPVVQGGSEAATLRIGPTVFEMPLSPKMALVRLVEDWTGNPLKRQPILPLLHRLMEKPLHAPAFSGALMVDQATLLISDGVLVGAINRQSGEAGDRVVEALPAATVPVLHPLPQRLPEGLVGILASVLHEPKVRHADLDSSFVNLPALATKLVEEKFDGLLRLKRGEAWALVLFVGGEHALSVFSKDWNEVPVEQSWQRWVSDTQVRANVEEKNTRPLNLWYRYNFREFGFEVKPVDKDTARRGGSERSGSSTSSRIRQMFQTSRSNPLATGQLVLRVSPLEGAQPSGAVSYEQAPAYRVLVWMLDRLPRFFLERDKVQSWKYLAEWIPLVRRAYLHHDLPRTGTRDSDDFDIVTSDPDGKVLHLAHRFAKITVEIFEEFLERVIVAKKARIKTGDVGGVLLIAPSFEDDVLAAYEKRIHSSGGSSFFGMEESFTGYAGFVRIGTRRGFHLLLVEEVEEEFEPLLLA